MKFLKWLFITPFAILGLAFAVANRHETTVSFDPFNGNDVSSPQVTVPLFLLLFATVLFGVILGGTATWLTQGKNRKAAREAKSEAEKWRSEADRLRAQATPVIRPASETLASEPRALVRPYS
jgi:uncharacterized integral membrane protein